MHFLALSLVLNTSATASNPFSELDCDAFVKLLSQAAIHPTNEAKSFFTFNDTTWYIDTKDVEALAIHAVIKKGERPTAIAFDRFENAEDRVRYYYNATMISPYVLSPTDSQPLPPKIYSFKLTCFPQMK